MRSFRKGILVAAAAPGLGLLLLSNLPALGQTVTAFEGARLIDGRGGAPVENQGELALLYLLIWAFMAANGPGGFSLDGLIAARRRARAAG